MNLKAESAPSLEDSPVSPPATLQGRPCAALKLPGPCAEASTGDLFWDLTGDPQACSHLSWGCPAFLFMVRTRNQRCCAWDSQPTREHQPHPCPDVWCLGAERAGETWDAGHASRNIKSLTPGKDALESPCVSLPLLFSFYMSAEYPY